jgi:hypothetical protein
MSKNLKHLGKRILGSEKGFILEEHKMKKIVNILLVMFVIAICIPAITSPVVKADTATYWDLKYNFHDAADEDNDLVTDGSDMYIGFDGSPAPYTGALVWQYDDRTGGWTNCGSPGDGHGIYYFDTLADICTYGGGVCAVFGTKEEGADYPNVWGYGGGWGKQAEMEEPPWGEDDSLNYIVSSGHSLFVGTTYKVCVSVSGGDWEDISPATGFLKCLWVGSSGIVYASAGTSSHVYQYVSGTTWTDLGYPGAVFGKPTEFGTENPTVITTSSGNIIVKRYNGAGSWVSLGRPSGLSGSVSNAEYVYSDGTTLHMSGNTSGITYYWISGTTWASEGTFCSGSGVSRYSRSKSMCVYDGQIWKTTTQSGCNDLSVSIFASSESCSDPPHADTITVIGPAVENITTLSAVISGTYSDFSNLAYTQYSWGFVWGTTSQGDPGDIDPSSSGYDDYHENIQEMVPGVVYSDNVCINCPGTTVYARLFIGACPGGHYIYSSNEINFETPSAITNGSGTDIDPYQIENYAGLLEMGLHTGVSEYFELTNDIDCSDYCNDYGFIPIGKFSELESFNGDLNGNGYTIRNLYIDRPSMDGVGLFSYTIGANVHNVNFDNADITGYGYTGIVTGCDQGGSTFSDITISNSTITTADGSYVGGFLGYVDGLNGATALDNIDLQAVSIDSSTSSYSGLFAGWLGAAVVTDCTADADSKIDASDASFIGGFSGYAIASDISNCYTMANVDSYGQTNCCGGFSGLIESSQISNCYSSNYNDSEYDGVFYGVLGSQYVGGFSGFIYATDGGGQNCVVDNCSTTSFVGAFINYCGGFSGFAGWNETYSTEITDCYASGNISGLYYSEGYAYCVGGFTGYWSDYTGNEITRCYALGDVTAYYYVYAGGFVGRSEAEIGLGGTISRSFATGDVDGLDCVGGFVGWIDNGAAIENCYARGNVTQEGENPVSVGGFYGDFGSTGDPIGVLTNCYSTGTAGYREAMPYGEVGGFGGYGYNAEYCDVTSCYWDNVTSMLTISDSGEGRDTAAMQTASTFIGWDFDTIWSLDEGCNDGYPCLLDVTPDCDPPSTDADAMSADAMFEIYGEHIKYSTLINATPAIMIIFLLIFFIITAILLLRGDREERGG